MEVWKPCAEGFYEASSLGRIRRAIPGPATSVGKVLRQKIGKYTGRYEVVVFNGTGKRRTVNVHRLVAEAFHGTCPCGLQCDHINGDKRDNRPDNLRYVTAEENIRHGVEMGQFERGEDRHNAVLTEQMVREIKFFSREGVRPAIIAEFYGVNVATIYPILSGRNWRWTDDPNWNHSRHPAR